MKKSTAITKIDIEAELPPLIRSIYDSMETDESLENQGVEFDFGLGVGKWKIAHAGNPRFQAAYAEAMKPYSQIKDKDFEDPAIERVVRHVMVDVYANHAVTGFTGAISRDGSEIPYSIENAAMLMKDLKHLFKLVREASNNFANYRKVYVEDTAGK